MAVVVIANNPNGTREFDEEMVRRLNLADDPPAGALARFAGPYEGGWRIISVWESREAWDAFRRDRLDQALQQAGRSAPPLEITSLESVRIMPQKR